MPARPGASLAYQRDDQHRAAARCPRCRRRRRRWRCPAATSASSPRSSRSQVSAQCTARPGAERDARGRARSRSASTPSSPTRPPSSAGRARRSRATFSSVRRRCTPRIAVGGGRRAAWPTVVPAASGRSLRRGHEIRRRRRRSCATGACWPRRRTAPAAAAGRWELPGGKVEPGEAPDAALVREVARGARLRRRRHRLARRRGADRGRRHVLRVALAALVAGEPDPRRARRRPLARPPTSSTTSTGWSRTGRSSPSSAAVLRDRGWG